MKKYRSNTFIYFFLRKCNIFFVLDNTRGKYQTFLPIWIDQINVRLKIKLYQPKTFRFCISFPDTVGTYQRAVHTYMTNSWVFAIAFTCIIILCINRFVQFLGSQLKKLYRHCDAHTQFHHETEKCTLCGVDRAYKMVFYDDDASLSYVFQTTHLYEETFMC